MPYQFPRCQIVPDANHQVSFQIDGTEKLKWHYGPQYPRPFFYPILGPSGHTLTRMGHPGAENHDHHRSVWFAHAKVLGIDFWSDNTDARIKQKNWLAYKDGDDEAVMATLLGWYDGHDPRELLEQEVIAAVRPGPEGETFLEIQTTFRPKSETLEFAKTNFGFLAVRMAKSISAYFGGGQLTDSNGNVGEPAIFGKSAKWMDYSGPVPGGNTEGITYFDHPQNPNHPTHWHVREDGWMGASVCMHAGINITRQQPLTLRYLLHAHNNTVDPSRAEKMFKQFSEHPGYEVIKGSKRHTQYEVRMR